MYEKCRHASSGSNGSFTKRQQAEVGDIRTEFVDVFGHGEADADQQHAGSDHQRCHDDHGALHPPVFDLERVERLGARQRLVTCTSRQPQLQHHITSGRYHVHSWFSTQVVGVDTAMQLITRQRRHQPLVIVFHADSLSRAPVD